VLWYKRQATQGEISSQLRRDKSTIARVVRNMERKGLLAFSPHPNDNRSRLASLTLKGESIQAAAIQVSGALYVRAIKGIATTDIRVALKVLAHMIRNCAPILFLFLGLCPAYAQPVIQAKRSLSRRYQLGETARYQLSCES
jgi:DNA-binding MarR family transcriptional regulator